MDVHDFLQIYLTTRFIKLAILLLTTWAFLNPFIGLIRNYFRARKIGLPVPILLTPVSLLGTWWTTSWALFGLWIEAVLLWLPCGTGSWVKYSAHSWFHKQKYFLHEQYGDVFLVVTPSEIEVVVANPEVAVEVNRRNMDFIKHEKMYAPLDIFGPSVDTVNGATWSRHRRLTTRPFNERNNALVWEEALAQSSAMLETWVAQSQLSNTPISSISSGAAKDEDEVEGEGEKMIEEDGEGEKPGVAAIAPDIMTLALHVLQRAGFGKKYPFSSSEGEGGVDEIKPGHTMTYKESLRVVLNNLFMTILMETMSVLPSWCMTEGMGGTKVAVGEFKGYMKEMVEQERENEGSGENHLLSVLARDDGKTTLCEDEIYGNLFLYNVAGHDTAANTMVAAILLMSANTAVQDWVRKEIMSVFPNRDVDTWEYAAAFPKLVRCLAVMHETLRLHGPVPGTSRYTDKFSRTIKYKNSEYILPPNTFIPINHAALQTRPEYWGEDSLVWRPDRWIVNSQKEGCKDGGSGEEKMYTPPAGTFLPWTGGPRVCPGKKFSQVEFVATVARLFRSHSVSPVLEGDETIADTQQRVLDTVEESIVNMTLQIRNPERVKLIWTKIKDAL